MDLDYMKQQIEDAFDRERKHREEEKKAKRAEYNRKYWAAHKNEIKEKRKLTKEHRTEWQRQWFRDNKEKWNEYMRKRRMQNKLKKGEDE